MREKIINANPGGRIVIQWLRASSRLDGAEDIIAIKRCSLRNGGLIIRSMTALPADDLALANVAEELQSIAEEIRARAIHRQNEENRNP